MMKLYICTLEIFYVILLLSVAYKPQQCYPIAFIQDTERDVFITIYTYLRALVLGGPFVTHPLQAVGLAMHAVAWLVDCEQLKKHNWLLHLLPLQSIPSHSPKFEENSSGVGDKRTGTRQGLKGNKPLSDASRPLRVACSQWIWVQQGRLFLR